MRKKITLQQIAEQAMRERGFLPNFSPEALQQLETIHAAPSDSTYKDLRHFLWVSIDNETSKDLDQLTFAEPGKIYIAVADVDGLVQKASPIDHHAAHNTTSVYTPTKVFSMLPPQLSTDLTSLNEHEERCAIVIAMNVDPSGRFTLSDVYRALVKNQAKLDYISVGAFLEHQISKIPLPKIAGLKEQLFLQDQIAQSILQYRRQKGALEFGEVKLHPIIVEEIPVGLEEEGRNRAHLLIENFMIAANVGATHYLKEKKLPTLRRVVRVPKRWERIVDLAKAEGAKLPPQPNPKALRQFLLEQQQKAPLQFPDLSLAIIKLLGRGEYILGLPGKTSPGHFDLSEQEYTHATAPNRRFPDLIMQRLLKSAISQEQSLYSPQELSTLAAHCTQKEDDANKVERRMVKCAAAFVLEKEVGRTFKAMVIGANPKGTWVRLQAPPVEGKLTKGFQGVDVGDFIQVKLTRVDLFNGHIDFARQN